MKRYFFTAGVLALFCQSNAQNYNAGPVHVNGNVYDASAANGSRVAEASTITIGTGGTWLLNDALLSTPRSNAGQSEVVKFSGGSYSRTTGYVNGYAVAENQAPGFILPVGEGSYMPLTINSALSTGNTMTAAWYDDHALTATNIAGVAYYFFPGYYDVQTATANLSVTPSLLPALPTGARMLGSADGVNFTDLGLAGTAVTLPAGSYQLRFANSSLVLPLTLTAFTATRQGQGSLLTWKVSAEENVQFYTVERSSDGRQFTTVGSLPSPGNTTQERSYRLPDATPLKGANYYRLKITEAGGKISYSPVRLLSFDAIPRIAVYPNPVQDHVTITGLESGMQVLLFNLQ
ncbi:MAG TPA: hypothetical protein VMR70_12565, partial [Flavisolibacter sp.]|nr:hypothetical protein [Flavisolibacter sp.]